MPKLTARNIKKIPQPTGSGARDVPDSLLVGLTFVLQHTGAASWVVRYRTTSGQQKRFTLGKYPALSVDAARDQAAEVLRRVAKGEDPQSERVALRSNEIADAFPDLAARFVETYCKPKNRTWLDQGRVLGLRLGRLEARRPDLEPRWHIIPGSPAACWDKRAVATITRREVAELIGDAVSSSGPAAATRLRATLSRFFAWLIEQGILEESPVTGTKPPSPAVSRDRVLTSEELSVVWDAAGALGTPFDAFVRMLILTAARRAEVAGMTETEIVDGVWSIPPGRSKNSEVNDLPLPRQALAIVSELPRHPSGLLFSTTGETAISGFSKMKAALDAHIAERRKLKPWTLHDLRRSAATGMASLGIEPHIVEAILGHRSGVISGVAAIYNRFSYRDEKAAALQRWADNVSLYNML